MLQIAISLPFGADVAARADFCAAHIVNNTKAFEQLPLCFSRYPQRFSLSGFSHCQQWQAKSLQCQLLIFMTRRLEQGASVVRELSESAKNMIEEGFYSSLDQGRAHASVSQIHRDY